MTVFVTGGCGFIGTHFVQKWLSSYSETLVNIDKLTYAANQKTSQIESPHYHFIQLDIIDKHELGALLRQYQPRAVVHFAAETHVDRSIKAPSDFITTNINGTYSLLQACLDYYLSLGDKAQSSFKLINISTDEVYGALDSEQPGFTEMSPLSPNSPYSASKAGADLLARSFFQTYGLPVITTRCSNNFGPHQNSEKFIPTIINSISLGKEIPIYGQGKQIRDWLYVLDHIDALLTVLDRGERGQVYNIGGGTELENIELAKQICTIMAEMMGREAEAYHSSIQYVDDRPGHDFRYAIQCEFIENTLGWNSRYDFSSALKSTVSAFLQNPNNV